MQYLDRDNVLAVLEIFGDKEITDTITAFPIYNDEANRKIGNWQYTTSWQLFEPNIADGNYIMRKIIFHTANCSNCNATITINDYDQYCPRCGAKMGYSEE